MTVFNSSKTFSDLVDIFLDGRLNKLNRQEAPAKTATVKQTAHPPVNILEAEEGFLIEMMAPGIPKEAIKLTVQNDTLTISYDAVPDAKEDSVKTLRSEFSVESFKRSFTLGDKVEASQISASHDLGILKVKIPKKMAAPAQVIAIEIK